MQQEVNYLIEHGLAMPSSRAGSSPRCSGSTPIRFQGCWRPIWLCQSKPRGENKENRGGSKKEGGKTRAADQKKTLLTTSSWQKSAACINASRLSGQCFGRKISGKGLNIEEEEKAVDTSCLSPCLVVGWTGSTGCPSHRIAHPGAYLPRIATVASAPVGTISFL